MILKLRFVRDVGRRTDARERAEIVDEMRLIEIAAGESNFGPIDELAVACYMPQDFLETLHAAEKLGRQTDLLGEELDEAPFAQPDLRAHAGDGAIR